MADRNARTSPNRPAAVPGRMSLRQLGLLIATIVLALDQATKWIILAKVMQPPRIIEITPFFNLVMGWNRGVSFGLFDSESPVHVIVLSSIAMVIVIALLVWLWRATERWTATALGLIVGGALGNVVDRLRFGAVADFLDFHAFGYHWPAFNAADSAIVVGAGMLIVESLFERQEKS